jgi:hypothetical protein
MTSKRNRDAFREALVWCLPALLIGGWLRIELLHGWQAGLYFGPDSGSYWESAFRFTQGGDFDVSGKRPWLYPALVWLASHGPISPAFSVTLLQQFAAWLSIVALGALVRVVLPWWKWFIIPTTVLYAGQPEILYWGHVLIADSLFISLTVTVALVVAFYWQQPSWHWLAVAMVLVFLAMALRPVGRALWLTCIPIALLVPGLPWHWKLLHVAALAVLYFPASAATKVTQGTDLLFVSTLPLIRLDTPLHADFKAELRPQVEAGSADLWQYVTVGQREVWGELIDDEPANRDTILQALRADKKRYDQVRREISREALQHSPFIYAGMVLMKIYVVYSLAESHERLDPPRWLSAAEKFLGNTFQKIGLKFPAFVLGDSSIVNEATLHTSLARTVAATGSQARVQHALKFFHQMTMPFRLVDKMPDRWWWIVPAAVGVLVFPWTREGRRLVPVLLLAAGYLAMTYLVGRAVGRYRLPVEFALFLSACAGLATLPNVLSKRAGK